MNGTSTKIPHPKSTRYEEDGDGTENVRSPLSKRRKVELSTPTKPTSDTFISSTRLSPDTPETGIQQRSPRKIKRESEDHEKEAGKSHAVDHGKEQIKTTQLEDALPAVEADEEAIEAYEAYKAGQAQLQDQDGSTSLQDRLENKTWVRGKNSIYVDAFNLALETVLEQEGHLFDEAEQTVFKFWQDLSYEAQYLYVRLFLRKTSAWHRISKLAYYGDIKDMDAAVAELQQERILPKIKEVTEAFPGETVLPEDAQPLGQLFKFADTSDEHINSLDEASNLLLLDELKVIAKDAKVQGKTKKELIQNLRRSSGKQTGLAYLRRSETEESIASADTDNVSLNGDDDESTGSRTPTPRGNRDAHYTKKILEQTGKCIRLSLIPLKLFERVHLVFYRSTEWTDKSLTTVILAKISRRNFPEYIVSRSANIFESRALLLEFEASLRTQFHVDTILEFSGTPGPKQMQQVLTIFDAVYPRWQTLVDKEQDKEERLYETGEGAYLRRFSPAWVYTRIVHKGLVPLARFKEHKREHELLTELLTQRLFHASRRGAWYQRKALLEEHYMYALTDAQGRSEEANKKHWKRIALRTCEQGLQDNECHLIYHYDLQKRITKLEKQLRTPKREQHDFGHAGLNKARERTIEGIQLLPSSREHTPSRSSSLRRQNSTADTPPDQQRRASLPRQNSTPKRQQQSDEPRSATKNDAAIVTPTRRAGYGGKTFWLDTLDTGQPVSVENFSLSYYRHTLGYKGYHSEGGILRCLFGLLFYDVMFQTYAPNVFQTPYQTCPLDLHTDAFYTTRLSEINARINELGEGRAETILRDVWSRESPKGTCVVGVRWAEYELEDLCELTRCFGGTRLGIVMRVLAQEYGARGGGVPDLFLWKPQQIKQESEPDSLVMSAVRAPYQKSDHAHGDIMFVEVKSENDRLSDTQRLWISVLLNAGIEVELCHVLASEVRSV